MKNLGTFLFLFVLCHFISVTAYAEPTKVSDREGETGCVNCTICPYPCRPPTPPPLSGYPSYGAPPPPAPVSGYPSYGAPPPPSQPIQGANCPPYPVQYPQHPPPSPFGYYPEGSATCTSSSIFSLVTVLLFSLTVVF